jgi:outer membrane receptor protein involved in Fe transport
MIKSFFKFTAILSLLLTSATSLAQVALEEMVVTSQKREQNLLDVPSALQAFSGDMLEDAGLRDTNDLINMVPDMLMSGEDSGRANIWLRGIGSTKFDIGSEGSNAFFVDEVYMSRNQSILTGLVDLERIEVLKGPQGTLYGRNALGGAISVYYKKPTSEFEQKIKVTAGDRGQEQFSYMLSGELSQDLYGRIILGYQDQEGMHKDNTFGGDTGTRNENIRASLFGEGTNQEWSLTFENAKSKDHAAVSEAVICKRDSTTCTDAQKTLIQPSLAATTSGLDLFVTDFSKTAAYVTAFAAGGGNPAAPGAAAQIDTLALNQITGDRYSSNLSEDTSIEREDTLIAGKFKSFRDNYDLTVLVSTNQNAGGELKDFDSTAAKSFVQGSTQKTNQSSLEIRWNSKPGDEIQWVAGIYSYLDYGDRSDIFRTGPDSVFNQAAVAATAYLDAGLFSQANLSALQSLQTYTPTASKAPLVASYNVATGTTLETYGTAQLDLSINNKSSAAFGQVTIPMAERWSITLGARYTYDNKGMRYETKSNSTGVPHSLILPGCTPTTVNPDGSEGCSDFVQLPGAGADASIYTSDQYAGQAAVVAGAFDAAPSLALAPGWQASCTFDNTNTIGSADWGKANSALIASTACNTNFEIVANAQGVGIAPIASAQQIFTLNQEKSWTSTDPKMTIDFKPNDRSMVWYTYATGFKAGGWQFANYFKETASEGFDPEELEMHEIGYKGSFLNDSLSLSAVAYAYDWSDKQVIKVSVIQGLPVGLTRNAAASTINGLDLNLRARVADQTIINFNYSYIDASYDNYCDDSRNWSEVHGSFTSCKLDPTTGLPDNSGAYSRSGGKMPWTPDNAMVLSVEHVEPTRIGDVVISTSYSHKTNVGNADERVAGLTLLDEIARLNFSTAIEFNNGTTLRGFCTNCLDVDDDIGFTLIYPGSQGGGARIKYYDGLRAGLEVIHRF